MKKLIILTIVILAAFAVVTQGLVIFISNTQASDSITATKLTDKIAKLQETNIELESKILSYASYHTIASRAAELGYENNPEFISVYEELPIALGR